MRAAELCKQAMRWTQSINESITAESALSLHAAPIGWSVSDEVSTALAEVEGASAALSALQRGHRAAILSTVAPGQLTAADALTRIDAGRRLDQITHHAWRAAAYLIGRGDEPE